MLAEEYEVAANTWSPDSYSVASKFGPFAASALNNQATIYVRLTAEVTASSTAGTVRVDNVLITGIPDEEPGIPPVLTGAVSVRTQGGAGAFSIDVGTGAVESRANGPMSLVAEFDIPIQLAGQAGDVTVSSGTVTGLVVDGSTLTVTMSGAANASLLTVGFPGVADANDVTAVSESTLCVPVLAGDATGDRAVNIFDLVQIRNALNQPVTAANFRTDVSADGSVNIFDLVAVRNSLNTSVAACP